MPIHETKHCKRCDTAKGSDEFYRRRGGTDLSPYCKKCSKDQSIERQRAFKKKCIEYKGGKCELCAYNRHDGALEFHHRDPTKKDFSISRVRLTNFNDKVTKELDKCIMLCANCHRETHGGLHIFT
jgi:hypothetical protein